jgi:hypothetical protein
MRLALGHPERVELARIAQSRDELTPDLSSRVARWLHDGGEPVPANTLLDAASATNLNGDRELGGELAEAAARWGAGVTASLVLARSHAIRVQFGQAETMLGGIESDAPTRRLVNPGVDLGPVRDPDRVLGADGARERRCRWLSTIGFREALRPVPHPRRAPGKPLTRRRSRPWALRVVSVVLCDRVAWGSGEIGRLAKARSCRSDLGCPDGR